MRLLYISSQRLPTEKAYGIQIAKTCESLAGAGAEIELVAPFRISEIKEDFFNYYKIKQNFKFTILKTGDFYLPSFLDKIAFLIKQFISALFLVYYAKKHKYNLVYSRDEIVIFILTYLSLRLYFEAHNFSYKKRLIYRRFKNKNVNIITISNGLKKKFTEIGFDENNVLVAHDGVDLSLFEESNSKIELKKELNLLSSSMIVMYWGSLIKWKGVDVLVAAAQKVSNKADFVVIGGRDEQIRALSLSDKNNKIRFLGFKPHSMLPKYLKVADVLILPNKRDNGISEFYTSPLKLFEYMASGQIIIASDLPSLREIINNNNAVFFTANDSSDLANKIDMVLENPQDYSVLGQNASKDVQAYSWDKRAEKILSFIK